MIVIVSPEKQIRTGELVLKNSWSTPLLLLSLSGPSQRGGRSALLFGLNKGSIIKVNVYTVFFEVFKEYLLPLEATCYTQTSTVHE